MNKTSSQPFIKRVQQNKNVKLFNNKNLPQITLSMLQDGLSSYKSSCNIMRQTTKQFRNHKQIKVSSPFYNRMQSHKQNCKCPYHKKHPIIIIPHYRHTDKSIQTNKMKQNTKLSKQKLMPRLSNEIKNKYLKRRQSTRTQSHINLNRLQNEFKKAKLDANNQSYQKFLKQCQFYMLRSKGFTINQPNPHVIRTSQRQIFQFINQNLHYNIDKMRNYIQSIQKDKDYGQFYVDRFKQIKSNYQRNLLNGKLKRPTGNLQQSLSAFRNISTLGNKKRANQSFANNKKFKRIQQYSDESQNEDSNRNKDINLSRVLQKIFQKLKKNQKILKRQRASIIYSQLSIFEKIFNQLNKDIENSKYKYQLLKRFQDQVMLELIRVASCQDQQIQNKQQKLLILNQTIQAIKIFKARLSNDLRKSQNLSQNSISTQRISQNDLLDQFQLQQNKGEQSNQENGGNHQRNGNKKRTNQGSKTTTKYESQNTQYVKSQFINKIGHKNARNHFKTGHGVRKATQDKQISLTKIKQPQNTEQQQEQLEQMQLDAATTYSRRNNLSQVKSESNRVILRRAQNSLYQMNFGEVVITIQDSIFTTKRKLRVIKMLIEQDINNPQSIKLRQYITKVQQRCLMKIQADKLLNQKKKKQNQQQLQRGNSSQYQNYNYLQDYQEKDQIIPKRMDTQANLDQNLGDMLIFYSIINQVKNDQSNQDLCILLNQIKIKQNTRLFANQISYKEHIDSERLRESLRIQTKQNEQNILIQQGLTKQNNINVHQKSNLQDEINQIFQKFAHQKKKYRQERLAYKNNRTLVKRNSILQNKAVKEITYQNYQNYFHYQRQNIQYNFDDEPQIKKKIHYLKSNCPQSFSAFVENTNIYQKSLYQSKQQSIFLH